jgi:glycosyltransferase involved in cell wall biosynthesis
MLKQMAQDLGVENNVEFMGNVTNVPELLTKCAALVLPSTTEGISLALLEAMATGLPTIATRVGGNPEVIEDGVTGILVPANDDQAIGDAMLRLHRDAELRRRMGEAGRVKVVRDFEIRRMVADYESLYLLHLRQRKPSRVTSASRIAAFEPSHPNA